MYASLTYMHGIVIIIKYCLYLILHNKPNLNNINYLNLILWTQHEKRLVYEYLPRMFCLNN